MVYYGFVCEKVEPKLIYPFLMESLSQATLDMPYRGPAQYKRDNLRYENKLAGNIKSFRGIEKIYKNGECVYEASYSGGLVDQ